MRTLTVLVLLAGSLPVAAGVTTIDPANKYAWSGNTGWIDGRGDTNNGAVVGEYVCRGYLYSANVGWINLGSGSPANGIFYQNNSAADFGVTNDGVGNLRGYAYSANVGWIRFENLGAPKVDLATGKLSGYAWSANCGWISLSNSVAYVQTDGIQQGTLAPDGLPVAWLLQNFGTTNINAAADADGDGMSNSQEYLAGTDPNNAGSVLRLTAITHGTPMANQTTLSWSAVPTRFYAVQSTTNLASGAWSDSVVLSSPGADSIVFNDPAANSFYRIRAFRYLTP